MADKRKPDIIARSQRKVPKCCGLDEPQNKLFFEVSETTFNTDKFILFMDKFSNQIVKRTVVILDNSPIHKSKKFMTKMEEWKENDLLVYFLPPYSPELTLIEILWRRIKYQWLPFEDLCFQNLKERLSYVLNNFGCKCDIIFNHCLYHLFPFLFMPVGVLFYKKSRSVN